MNCCNDNGQCTQGANCPVRKQNYESQAKEYKNNFLQMTATIHDEKNDVPPFGYSHDFIAMLAIWVVGIVLGITATILFLLG